MSKLTVEEMAVINSQLKPEAGEPRLTFVVLTGWEKMEILYPDVIGPFESFLAAYTWVAQLPNASVAGADSPWAGEIYLEPVDGGYAGFAIVDELSAVSPEGYMASRWDEEEDHGH